MATLTISNVNTNNDHMIKDIAGIAGFAGSVKLVDCLTRTIDILTEEERTEYLIQTDEIERMIGAFVMAGFTVTLND